MNSTIIVAGIIIFGLLIVLVLIGWHYVFVNKPIIESNEEILNQRKILINQIEELNLNKNKIDKEIVNKCADLTVLQQEEKILQQKNIETQNFINNTKQAAEEVYQEKKKNLDAQFNKDVQTINTEIAMLQTQQQLEPIELESLQKTRAAVIEAARKEQLIKENQDFYCLKLPKENQRDVQILEDVKEQISKPRAISMLIWTTYYSPIAKKKLPQWLGNHEVCGIYKITNIQTGECYIGQAKDVRKRLVDHMKHMLQIDVPVGNKLYAAAREYGIESFSFELLEECISDKLNEKEKYYIKLYQSNIVGYNGTKGGN